jgi:hypothetical protein
MTAVLISIIVVQLVLLILVVTRSSARTNYLWNIINNLRARGVESAPNSRVSPNSEYVASVTTIKSRLHLVDVAIRSILEQSAPPRGVYLYISDRIEADEIPDKLRALEPRGLTIRFVEDVGPHTKLVYALKEHSSVKIVTFDDDMIYPINMAACLLEHAQRFPGCVVANWARRLPIWLGQVQPIRRGKLLTPPRLEQDTEQRAHNPKPSLRTFAYGTSGVLYPPGALHPTVFDFKQMRELTPTEDDVWFKAMSILQGTRTVETNLGINPKHFSISGSQTTALRHINHGTGKNAEQLRAVFARFDLLRLIREGESRGSSQ